MGVNNSLLKSIQTIVDKAIEIAPFDKTRQAQIITNNGDGSYTVRLDGILYNNVPSYPKTNVLEVGSIAKIVTPGNQSSQMYIQSSKGGGGGDHKELTSAEYEALTPEQKNDGTVYFVTDGDPDYFIMSDSVPIMNSIYYKDKQYIGTGSINNTLLVGNKTSEEINVVDMTNPKLTLDGYQTEGNVDKEIYDALVSLGWTDCIV